MGLESLTICVIAKDEKGTLGRLAVSLRPLTGSGAHAVLVDTGSTDGTPEMAESLGFTVYRSTFDSTVSEKEAGEIVTRLGTGSEGIVKVGDRTFDFSAARNYAASKARGDWILAVDCDEEVSADPDRLALALEQPVPAYRVRMNAGNDSWGSVRLYRRSRRSFEGMAHECVSSVDSREIDHKTLSLRHLQEKREDRSSRIATMAIQAVRSPENGRHSFHLGRELMYLKHHEHAVTELRRAARLHSWAAEKAQALAFAGDCLMNLGKRDEAIESYRASAKADPKRRIGLLREAKAMCGSDWSEALRLAREAKLREGPTGYVEDMPEWGPLPYLIEYPALWQLGRQDESREVYAEAREKWPDDPKIVADWKWYRPEPEPMPKILHHIWVGPRPAPMEWIKTWYEKHPDWEHILWDNDKVFNREWKNQRLVDEYRARECWHGVADVVRYEILHEFGGLMPGADSVCERNTEELFDRYHDAWAVYENETVRPGLITPLYACRKGAEFALRLIEELKDKESGEPWLTTGNCYMRDMVAKHRPSLLRIFPSHYFNPIHYTGHTYSGPDKPFSVQKWGTTLKSYNQKNG